MGNKTTGSIAGYCEVTRKFMAIRYTRFNKSQRREPLFTSKNGGWWRRTLIDGEPSKQPDKPPAVTVVVQGTLAPSRNYHYFFDLERMSGLVNHEQMWMNPLLKVAQSGTRSDVRHLYLEINSFSPYALNNYQRLWTPRIHDSYLLFGSISKLNIIISFTLFYVHQTKGSSFVEGRSSSFHRKLSGLSRHWLHLPAKI